MYGGYFRVFIFFYFITGTPCGGKTTISRALSKKYGFAIYDLDEEFPKHKSFSNNIDQPAMNKEFANADEFFLRPYKEYGKWLVDNTREQLDFVVTDLISMSKDQIVICDLHLTLDEAILITIIACQHIGYILKGEEKSGYLKIKIMELLLFSSNYDEEIVEYNYISKVFLYLTNHSEK